MQYLRQILAWWRPIAEAIANFQARLLLVFFYFIVVTPFAVGVKLLSDPLRLRIPKRASYWVNRERVDTSIEGGRRQF